MTQTLTRLAFTCQPKPLAAAAAWAARRIPSKPAPAILGGILIECAEGTLRLSGFDYDVCARADLAVDDAADGRVLVSGRLFADLVKTLPAKPVQATVDDTALTIRCGTVRLTLPLMTGEDYPTPPTAPATIGTVDAQAFARLADLVTVAADIRGETAVPFLTGAHLTFSDGRIQMLASNRYRGAIGSVEWAAADPDTVSTALVPASVLVELARTVDAPGEIVIGLSGGMASFTADSRSVVARLLDPKDFPAGSLPRLIPARGDTPTVVPVAELLAAVKRAAMVLEPKAPVRLLFDADTVTVSGGDDGSNAADETVGCQHAGPALDISISVTYLTEGLAVLDTATAELTLPPNGRKPLLITMPDDGTYRAFLMPIRKD